MAKQIQIVAIALIVSVAICNASPARLERLKPSKSKFLARQEVAEQIPAQTPYPPAGIRPEVRFDLPTDEKLIAPGNTYLPPVGIPAQTYGPPAKTYGPPEVSVKDEVEEVANNEPVQPQEQPQPRSEEPQPEEPKPEEPQPEVVSSEQPEEVDPSQQSEEEPQQEDNDVEDDTDAEAQQSEEEPQQEDNAIEDDADTEAQQIEAEIERVEAEEGLINPFPERIVLARNSGRKAAKLRSAKLQVAQPIYLVNFNGRLYRLLN